MVKPHGSHYYLHHDLRETTTYLVALHTVRVLKMRYYNMIFKALPDHRPNSQ